MQTFEIIQTVEIILPDFLDHFDGISESWNRIISICEFKNIQSIHAVE